MLLEGVRLGMTLGLLLAVPAVCWQLLRDRKGAVPIVVGCTLGYLVLGNLLSQVMLLDVIFPADPASSGRSLTQLQLLLFFHTAVSMGIAASTTVAVATGLSRVLQRAPKPPAPAPVPAPAPAPAPALALEPPIEIVPAQVVPIDPAATGKIPAEVPRR